MGVYVRVGLGAGAIGFALLYAAQLRAGLGALALLALVALSAGLGVAKWLPRDWYGRQLVAGVRAGGIACGLAVAGLFLSLGVAGRHTIPALARQSHLFGLDLGSAVRTLGVAGWVGAALALGLVGGALGAGLSALVALIAAWGKSQHAIQVVEQAREAAQRSARLLNTGGPSAGRATSADDWQPGQYPSLPLPGTSPERAGQGNALRAALGAWAEGRNSQNAKHAKHAKGRASAGKTPPAPPPPPPQSDQDSWLC